MSYFTTLTTPTSSIIRATFLLSLDLLSYLVENAGRVLQRHNLIDVVWGSDYVGDTKTLDVHVRRLRMRIEADPREPRRIQTVRGVGYRFADQ